MTAFLFNSVYEKERSLTQQCKEADDTNKMVKAQRSTFHLRVRIHFFFFSDVGEKKSSGN